MCIKIGRICLLVAAVYVTVHEFVDKFADARYLYIFSGIKTIYYFDYGKWWLWKRGKRQRPHSGASTGSKEAWGGHNTGIHIGPVKQKNSSVKL